MPLILVAILTLSLLYWFAVRRWMSRWGATPSDLTRIMAGDALLSDPTYSGTLAVIVNAAPEQIWPWLVQIGYRRGGLYSYDWLDRLFARNLWLDMGRKRPIPLESHFAVAGYFFYYGHYYAALCIDLLPPEERPFYQDHLANVLLPIQEKDGDWWDYPLYNYHQQYGTAFALMSLKRCLKP